MITSEEIKRRLWNGANELRGSMDASRYKDYMLGLMFYKFLSDQTLNAYKVMNKGFFDNLSEKELFENFRQEYNEMVEEGLEEDFENTIINMRGYFIPPDRLYQRWIESINDGTFELSLVSDSLKNFDNNFKDAKNKENFKSIFSSSLIDLSDSALGSDLTERSKNIQALIGLFSDLNMAELQEGDILGDAYEYLIGMFAMDSGKKAGEFYTPHQVSEVIAQIVTRSSDIQSIYDPTVGSGSLLLTVGNLLTEDQKRDLQYYGQEKNTSTYNLCRMNLLLHGVLPSNMNIRNGDTLAEDWPDDPRRPNEAVQFDAVVMNPPYSLSRWNKAGLKVSDPRFQIAGVLPPKSKGDYAFLLHGLYHLGQNGTMAIVLPHGVLFRGGAEGEIRKRLLEKNHIDTIIGLPANLFTNTGIPVVILVLKKNRELNEKVLIIDASHDFVKRGKQNVLLEKDIARIADTFENREEIPSYSYLASREDIIENDFNLNIPRYVSAAEDEIPHDVEAHLHGGIPLKNIEDLEVLQDVMPDVIEKEFALIRPGYVQPKQSLEELSTTILNDQRVKARSNDLQTKVQKYLNEYWDVLRKVDSVDAISANREKMLKDIKSILKEYQYIDTYDGFQIIAEVWNKYLKHDLELIANSEFYSVCKTREPNMVTKGSGRTKREEQEGWKGTIVPNALIIQELYSDEENSIREKEAKLSEAESEFDEILDAAKNEESEESAALYEFIKKDDEGEPKDSFDLRYLRKEIKKETDYDPDEFKWLKKVDKLDSKIKRLRREVRNEKKELDKAAEERILVLNNDEIDFLVYKKWFGDIPGKMLDLVEAPLKEEIKIIENLHERYESTLADIDSEIEQIAAELREMMEDLVVTYE